jgi:MauM/NapG family ferredoxin protein
MKISRRNFLKLASPLLLPAAATGKTEAASILFSSPVKTNLLRPPGAVPEDIFASKCIRCGRCVEVCPYHSIVPGDTLSVGVHAGTPLIDVTRIPCYLCMKCVKVCPTGSLQKIIQAETRMGLAVIDRYACMTWKESGFMLCRTCYNVCPYKEKAIKLDELRPVVQEQFCTGCGICVHGCPVTLKNGKKAINIEPVYSSGTINSQRAI